MNALSPLLSSLVFGPPTTFGALTCVPLLPGPALPPAPAGRPLVLEEALAGGRFTVGEVSEGGSVPSLLVLNQGEAPVFLLDGEELAGARQNRVLNLSLLVPAGSRVEIPVSCVEAGRWHYQRRDFLAAGRTQFAGGRARRLSQVSDSLARSGRAEADQDDVWQAIDAKAQRMAAFSDTRAMAAIYQEHDAALDDYLRALPPAPGQLGAVYLIGERVAGLDLFATPALAARLAPKVLRGYAIDALEELVPPAENPGLLACQFLWALAESRGEAFAAPGGGQTLRLRGEGQVAAALLAAGAVLHLEAFAVAGQG